MHANHSRVNSLLHELSGLDMYEWLRGIQDAVHAKQPNALVYINGGDGSSESTTFDAAFDKAVQPDVYSFDFYPSFGGKINGIQIHDTRGVQLRLLEDARLVSQARGVPLWCVITHAYYTCMLYYVPAVQYAYVHTCRCSTD